MIQLLSLAVFFLCTMRSVNCFDCGVTTERVPWAEGKSPVATSFAWFLAGWAKRLSWKETIQSFFEIFGDLAKDLVYVCSDMWKPYLKVIAERAEQAIHVLDRFHIMANINKAIDKVRATEVKDLKTKGPTCQY